MSDDEFEDDDDFLFDDDDEFDLDIEDEDEAVKAEADQAVESEAEASPTPEATAEASVGAEEEKDDLAEDTAQPAEPAANEEAPTPAPEASPAAAPAPAAPMVSSAPAGAIDASDIPLTVNLEVGRLQLSAQKLMDLRPGNLLELGAKPEQGIDLVINGKVVGRGELLKVGDGLGLRVTSLA